MNLGSIWESTTSLWMHYISFHLYQYKLIPLILKQLKSSFLLRRAMQEYSVEIAVSLRKKGILEKSESPMSVQDLEMVMVISLQAVINSWSNCLLWCTNTEIHLIWCINSSKNVVLSTLFTVSVFHLLYLEPCSKNKHVIDLSLVQVMQSYWMRHLLYFQNT